MALEFNFKKGDRLVLELASAEILEGTFSGGSSERIDVVDVIAYSTNVEIKQLSLYRLEIVSVHLLKESETTRNETEEKGDTSDDKVIQISKGEYERLKQMTLDYIYMPTVDNRYVEATNHLLSCESVGVVGLGGEFGRMRTISLLIFSSWDQIYIFDLYLYHKKTFPPELRSILESDSIRKIIHDSRALVDSLYHCNKVRVNNIFDTQVADIMITKSQNGTVPHKMRNISDCLTHYLNFPNTLLLTTRDIKSKKWDQRPLTDTCKTKAAQLSTYLFTLKVKFENIMLKNFNDAVKIHSTSVRDVNSCMALLNLNSDDTSADVKKAAEKDFFS